VKLLEPLPYVDFMNIVLDAKLVITDSGGLQEETTYLGSPCLTVRNNTERPITITQGTNRLVKPPKLAREVEKVLDQSSFSKRRCPALWDGHAATRAVKSLEKRLFVQGKVRNG
jgi:UDP-N-acetylglucosamine 2-epimerase (non-hydrolysing)